MSGGKEKTAGRPGWFRLWWLAIRPKTLTVAAAPVLVGTTMAYADSGALRDLTFLVTLATAMLIQIAANLHNDSVDTERGADGAERTGPIRITAQGWVRARTMRWVALGCFGLAILGGEYLVWAGGWPILLLGFFAVISGWAYSGGIKPISYTPLGEVFVFLFFGLLAVPGAYWLQHHAFAPEAVLAGAALGFMAAAVLMVNNYRDMDQDRAAGRRTLALVLGPSASKTLYAVFMLMPYAFVEPMTRLGAGEGAWLALLALPFALLQIHRFRRTEPGPAFNAILAGTAKAQMLFAVILSAGALRWPA